MSLLLALAAIALEPAPAGEEEREILSWTCSVGEQLDRNVGGSLSMMVYPGGRRDELSYSVHWAAQPGHIAEQNMIWIWVPLDAAKLWKPGEIGLSVKGERDDEGGSVSLSRPDTGGFGDRRGASPSRSGQSSARHG